MTKHDLSGADHPSDGAVLIKRALLGIGGGITLVFIAGVIAGYSSAVIEHSGPDLIDAAIIAAMLLAGLAVGYGMWRFWPRGSNEPEAPRVKSARMILIAVCVLSLPLGIMLGANDETATGLFSNEPISTTIAFVAIGIWLIAVPLLTWMWWQRVDEHEAGAYRDSSAIAVHVYTFLAPAWWMASRAGWLPNQDPMIVLLIVSVVWLIVWFVRKYL